MFMISPMHFVSWLMKQSADTICDPMRPGHDPVHLYCKKYAISRHRVYKWIKDLTMRPEIRTYKDLLAAIAGKLYSEAMEDA